MFDGATSRRQQRRRMGEEGGREERTTNQNEGWWGGRKRGSSITSKQNRGGPASPSHPPWLHRNTRAMPTLQTHSFPLSSATLHYPVLSQARRGTAPLSPNYSRVPAHSLTARLPLDPGRVYAAPSGIGSHSLYMHSAETTLGGLRWYLMKRWLLAFFWPFLYGPGSC